MKFYSSFIVNENRVIIGMKHISIQSFRTINALKDEDNHISLKQLITL